jgi:O-antigen/teichoic acid export membrane protein
MKTRGQLDKAARALPAKRGGALSTSSLLTGARIAGALAGFATQVVLARSLQAHALGVFFSVTSLAAVVGLICAHGYPAIAARFVSRYREQGKEHLIAAFVGESFRVAAISVTIATLLVLAGAAFWPSFDFDARLALAAAALSIPAHAYLRLNGYFAAAIRRFALSYLPDTSIRPFLLLGGVLVLIACGLTLTAGLVTWLLTAILTALALTQFALLRNDLPKRGAAASPRLIKRWRREANPLILVALFTNYFADVDILLVTPFLTSAGTAMLGVCLKLCMLVAFAVQVAHQVVVPDLADARARKNNDQIREAVSRAFSFPLAITLGALVLAALWGENLLAIFGPEFASAKAPLLILLACQLARALFGPSAMLLTVIGAQRQNAALAMAALVVLAVANLVLAPLYGVLGAAVAVTIATLFWLIGCAVVLARLSGLRTDLLFLIGGNGSPRSATA